MKKILIVLTILLALCGYSYAACTGSSPTWTSTPDQASLQSCVTQATRGDTINVSAGTVTWSNQVYSTKALSIIGAGSSTSGTNVRTGLRTAGVTNSRYNETFQVPMIHFALSDADDGYLTRISGFRLFILPM